MDLKKVTYISFFALLSFVCIKFSVQQAEVNTVDLDYIKNLEVSKDDQKKLKEQLDSFHHNTTKSVNKILPPPAKKIKQLLSNETEDKNRYQLLIKKFEKENLGLKLDELSDSEFDKRLSESTDRLKKIKQHLSKNN